MLTGRTVIFSRRARFRELRSCRTVTTFFTSVSDGISTQCEVDDKANCRQLRYRSRWFLNTVECLIAEASDVGRTEHSAISSTETIRAVWLLSKTFTSSESTHGTGCRCNRVCWAIKSSWAYSWLGSLGTAIETSRTRSTVRNWLAHRIWSKSSWGTNDGIRSRL
jgi:hypothetical protein